MWVNALLILPHSNSTIHNIYTYIKFTIILSSVNLRYYISPKKKKEKKAEGRPVKKIKKGHAGVTSLTSDERDDVSLSGSIRRVFPSTKF